MKHPKQTCMYLICLYPSLFNTMLSAYCHLFLTIGNGFMWENGYITEITHDDMKYENYSTEKMVNLGLEKLEKNYETLASDKYFNFLKQQSLFTIHHAEEIVMHVPMSSDEITNKISDLSLISNVPGNITDLWLDAAEKFIMLYIYRINLKRFYDVDKRYLNKQNYLAQEIKINLEELRKTRTD